MEKEKFVYNNEIKKRITHTVAGFIVLFSTSIMAEQPVFSQPESAYFYTSGSTDPGVYFISSTNGDDVGWVSKLAADGSMINSRWATDLRHPMGMRVSGKRLWINNTTEIVGLNLDNPNDRIVHPIDGAISLNDLATDSSGHAYLSDLMNNRVVRVDLATGENSTYISTLPSSPNGVLVQGDRLYIASWGVMSDRPEERAEWITKTAGDLYWVSLKDSKKSRHIIVPELGNLDGVEIDQKGNIYVSDWESGKLYKISSGAKMVVGLGQYGQGLADIGLNSLTGELVLPVMLSSEVLFFTPSPELE
jgi:sugar lactone lactonase YvrE